MKKEIIMSEKYEKIRVRHIRREVLHALCKNCNQPHDWLTVAEAAEIFQKDPESIAEELSELRKTYQTKKEGEF